MPTPSAGHKVSIKDIDVPLVLMLTFIVAIVGGVTSMSLVWWQTTSHATDTHTHVPIQESIEGGGVAYKQDVARVEETAREERRAQYKATRKLLTKMQITCQRTRKGLVCGVTLPEE